MTTIIELEEEIKKLEKEKEEAERNFHSVDGKERRHLSEMQKNFHDLHL